MLVGVVAAAALFLASPSGAAASSAATVDPALFDRAFLLEESYFDADGLVPVIIEMRVPPSPYGSNAYRDAKREVEDTLRASGRAYRIGYDLPLIGGLAGRIDPVLVETLGRMDRIERVSLDWRGEALLLETTELARAVEAWGYTTPAGEAANGEGIRVAVIDSGLGEPSSLAAYLVHPDLGGCFGAACRVVDSWNFVDGNNNTKMKFNHGLYIAGIIASNGEPGPSSLQCYYWNGTCQSNLAVRGIAPGALIQDYLVCADQVSCPLSNIIAALQRALDPNGDGNREDSADIASISIGYQCPGGCDGTDAVSVAVDNAADFGLLSVIAAGNDGRPGSVMSPGAARSALTVGAISKADILASFSSRGPTADGRIKPDVLSYGVDVVSLTYQNACVAWPEQGVADDPNVRCYATSRYGTSFATPHASGIAALVKQRHGNWTPQQVKSKIMASAVDLGYAPNEQGAGAANALYALDDLAPAVAGALDGGATATASPSVAFAWSCADTLSDKSNPVTGIRKAVYTVNGGAETPLPSESGEILLDLASDGRHTVIVRCTDRGGNVAEATMTIVVDTTPPTTTFAVNSTLGPAGWYKSPVAVALLCDDGPADTTAGCDRSYRWVGDDGPIEGTAFALGEGAWEVTYRSRDLVGNVGPNASSTFLIDVTAPSLAAATTPPTPGEDGWLAEEVTVELTTSDATSGLDSAEYRVNDGAWTFYDGPLTLSDGRWNVSLRATDVAGNEAVLMMDEIRVDRDAIVTLTRPSANETVVGLASIDARLPVDLSGENVDVTTIGTVVVDGHAIARASVVVARLLVSEDGLVYREAANVTDAANFSFAYEPAVAPVDRTIHVKVRVETASGGGGESSPIRIRVLAGSDPPVQPATASRRSVAPGDALEISGSISQRLPLVIVAPSGEREVVLVETVGRIDLHALFGPVPADGTWTVALGPTSQGTPGVRLRFDLSGGLSAEVSVPPTAFPLVYDGVAHEWLRSKFNDVPDASRLRFYRS